MSDTENRWVIPFGSRVLLVEHIASVMRNRAYPEFSRAPVPLWALDAAEQIVVLFEGVAKAALVYGGADRAHRLLHSARLWMLWLEEPTLEVFDAWIAAATDELGLTALSKEEKP